MIKFISLIISFYIINVSIVFSQDFLFFDTNAVFSYKSVFKCPVNNVETNETIDLINLGKDWEFQKKQRAIKYIYFPDTIGLKKFINPVVGWQKRMKKYKPWTWSTSEITGVIKTENFFWIHPPRNNQYVYCQIAPFPEVKISKLILDSTWSSNLYILGGLPKRGDFKGVLKSEFHVLSKVDYNVNNLIIKNCWIIEAIGVHNKLGESRLKMIYHENYGFLSLDYIFYDGTILTISLQEIKKK